MIVTCEACSSRYRIRPEKLPPQGGKIRCPSCSHVFIVRPPKSDPESTAERPAPASESQSADTPARPARPVTTPVAPVDDPRVPGGETSDDRGSPEESSPGEDTRAWKLRVSGLTYAFQTLESVQNWLGGRDSLDNIKVAREGEDWGELGDYPEVLSAKMRSRFFPDGKVPTSSSPATPKADAETPASRKKAARPSTPSTTPISRPSSLGPAVSHSRRRPAPARARKGRGKGKKKKAKVPADYGRAKLMGGLFAGLVALTLLLHFSGIIDLGTTLPFFREPSSEIPDEFAAVSTSGTSNPGKSNKKPRTNSGQTDPNDNDSDNITIVEDDQIANDGEQQAREVAEAKAQQLQDNLDKARGFIDEDDYARALATLIGPANAHPDNLDVQEMLLEVYDELGSGYQKQYQALKPRVEALREARQAEETEPDDEGGDQEDE